MNGEREELILLRAFVDLYWETYAATDHHPSAMEEARVINAAGDLRERWRRQATSEMTDDADQDDEAGMINWCTTHNRALEQGECCGGGIMIPCETVEVESEEAGRAAYAERWKRKPEAYIQSNGLWIPNPESRSAGK